MRSPARGTGAWPRRKKGQSPTSVTRRRTRQRQAASFEFSPQIVWSKSARWPMGVASCLRSRKRTPPSFWPTTRPHGGGGCSHQHAAQVHDGTVIKFVPIPIKTKTSSASMNSGKMLQRDTGRAVLISSRRQIQSQPSKKNSSGSGFDTNLQGLFVFR